ncbi:MAG: hypothetical protein ACUVQX_01695 [Candidatus Bathycorpusculaceae bacterium]
MSSKRKKSIIDEIFGGSIFEETEKFFEEFPEELEGGYSISVMQTPEGTKVLANVGKNVDADTLKKQLQRKYPNAKIEIEGGKKEPLIKEISTKNLKEENEE